MKKEKKLIVQNTLSKQEGEIRIGKMLRNMERKKEMITSETIYLNNKKQIVQQK